MWRSEWAKECNLHLKKEQQIDHRSYERQGKIEIPTIHEGADARKIEEKYHLGQFASASWKVEENRIIGEEGRRNSDIEREKADDERRKSAMERISGDVELRKSVIAETERGIVELQNRLEKAMDVDERLKKLKARRADGGNAGCVGEHGEGTDTERYNSLEEGQRDTNTARLGGTNKMISHGLLICSFFMKKKYSRTEDEILALNGSYEYDEVTYDNIFSLFSGFYDNYTELADDEKLMKMFSIDRGSIKRDVREDYVAESGIIHAGSYGTESDITNKTTKRVVYRRNQDDADIKQFHYMIYVPNDVEGNEIVKGMLLFETIGTFGVKTISVNNMKKFFSEKYGLTMETRSISVRIFIENLLKKDKLKKVTLIKNSVSRDPSDNMFLNIGREEKTYIKPTLKESWITKLLEHLDGRSSEDIFEINDEVYEDIQLSFLHAGRTKTVRLNNIDKFSMVEDVPDYVFIDDRNGGKKLIEYMEQTANNYASKMIFVRN